MRPVILITICLLISILSLSGCRKDATSSTPENQLVIIDDFQNFDPASIEIDAFEISEPRISGDDLIFSISYSGGCQDHQFTLYSTLAVMESQPPQASAWLSHNGNDDFCEAYLTEEIRFDLTELKENADSGSLLLRLHPFQEENPITPLLLYEW